MRQVPTKEEVVQLIKLAVLSARFSHQAGLNEDAAANYCKHVLVCQCALLELGASRLLQEKLVIAAAAALSVEYGHLVGFKEKGVFND